MLQRILLCLCMVFFCQGMLYPTKSNAQNVSKQANMLMQEIAQMQNLSHGDIEIPLTEDDKTALQKALSTDKIAYNADPVGSHLFGLVTLQTKDTQIIFGISGENNPVLTLRKNQDQFHAFDITIKNLSAVNKVATELTNKAFKNGTSNIDALLQSFGVRIQKSQPKNTTTLLTAQEKAALPALLLTKEWRLTANYDHSKNTSVGPTFIIAENDYMKMLSFKQSNLRYFVNFTFDDDYSNIQIEIPKKAFENIEKR